MFFNLILAGIAFVEANLPIVTLLIALMSYVKKATEFPWRKPWMLTVAAFLLGFLLAFPEGGVVDWLNFVVTGIFLGLTTTGLYDVIKKVTGK